MDSLTPDEEAQVVTYQEVIANLRRTWKSCHGETGHAKRGPTFYAITRCDDDGHIGMTSMAEPIPGKRWMCMTCVGFAAPIWSDNPDKCPSEDEALHEYTEWVTKTLELGSALRPQRTKVKRTYMLDGTRRGKYAREREAT